MTLLSGLLWLICALGSVALLGSSIAVLVFRRRCPTLIELSAPAPAEWPRLSAIVPACNEADTIEAALSSLLGADYPALEVIVINDRSTDETGAILDRMARSDARIIPVHLTELPEGWLGKVHALAQGLERSQGKWVLFTDADVHFERDALRRAVGHAEAAKLNHLAVLPEIPIDSFPLGIAIAAAFRSLVLMTRMWQVNDPSSSRGMGVGAFNLVRKEAFVTTPGLEWLKLEVADDVALGIMMKREVGSSGLVDGRDLVRVRWYSTLSGAVRGLEKNGFAQVARFRASRGFAFGLAAALLALAPFLALLPTSPLPLRVLALLALSAHVGSAFALASKFAVRRPHIVFSVPLGDLILAFIVIRATYAGIRRGGVVWRGTHYSSTTLSAGRRIDL